jgi:hypothetical protein
MRKRLIDSTPESIRTRSEGWLDIESAAVVEVTSEDPDCPVESAFGSGDARGWRAAAPGSQTIRLVFDEPQRLKCILLVFEENETARTQEFVLRWSPDGGSSVKEIVRQQWNFSPPDSIREVEEYQVDLSSVTVLELVINPLQLRISVYLDVVHGIFVLQLTRTRELPKYLQDVQDIALCGLGVRWKIPTRRRILWVGLWIKN